MCSKIYACIRIHGSQDKMSWKKIYGEKCRRQNLGHFVRPCIHACLIQHLKYGFSQFIFGKIQSYVTANTALNRNLCCIDWREITLLSAPVQVFVSILRKQLLGVTENKIHIGQAEFSNGQIFSEHLPRNKAQRYG